MEQSRLQQADENPVDKMFDVVKTVNRARLGCLTLHGRPAISTPHFLAITSRGVIPHITQDNFACQTDISGVYVALEDFIERAPKNIPPLYQFCALNESSTLKRFIALPDETLLVLGARRTPPVAAALSNSNTHDAVSVCTSVGFQSLNAKKYARDAETLQADIIISLGDIPYERSLGSKRIEVATDRNIDWLQDHITTRKSSSNKHPAGNGGGEQFQSKLFASLLPVPCYQQQFFIDHLTAQFSGQISGLVLYSADTLEDLPEDLDPLPRLALTTPPSPQDVLRQISLGMDILTLPFLTTATDAGIALDFTLLIRQDPSAASANNPEPLPLGIDMWSPTHATSLAPLSAECTCYACTAHHRAFIQHLLSAKEMLGWVLLQLHNHALAEKFFADIRTSLAAGTFEGDCEAFGRRYEFFLPVKTGQGPRMRGYQFKSAGPGESKKNPVTFTPLNERAERHVQAAAAAAAMGRRNRREERMGDGGEDNEDEDGVWFIDEALL